MTDTSEQALAQLSELRVQVDAVDRALLALLAQRASLARAVSAAKQSLGRPVRDASREEAALSDRRAWAVDHGLDPAFVDSLFQAILPWSRALQEQARGR